MATLVKNFSHLWERRYLDRGRGSIAGHLKGKVSPKSKVIDFREQIGVYVLYDKDMKAVYVGQAGYGVKDRLLDRLKKHEKDHLWNRWAYFSWYGIRQVTDTSLHAAQSNGSKYSVSGATLIEQLEGVLISVLEPTLNRQGATWKGTQEYFQVIDHEVREVSLNDLQDQFSDLERRLDAQKWMPKIGTQSLDGLRSSILKLQFSRVEWAASAHRWLDTQQRYARGAHPTAFQ